MKIVIACDSFKGSLTSAQVASAATDGIRLACPGGQTVEMVVADGGEGTAEAVTAALGGVLVGARVFDPLMREISATYGIIETEGVKTAVIDMASAAGLTTLSGDERCPMVTTTYGVGMLMTDAWSRGCRRYLVGIGGSATNDAGKGMLEALGLRFLDSAGRPLAPGGASLAQLAAIETEDARTDILGADITVMCDVDNPLCGPTGASAVYGPQKGADARMVAILDGALGRYARVVQGLTGRDVADIPGSGAAGGLGAAFLAFTGARMVPGIEAVLDIMGFDDAISDADLVITGEGRIDGQTLHGKVPAGVLARASHAGVPVVAIAGEVCDRDSFTSSAFAAVLPIVAGPVTLADAMQPAKAAANISYTCCQIVRLILSAAPTSALRGR